MVTQLFESLNIEERDVVGLWLLGASECADDEAPSSDVFLHPALGG